MGVFLRFTIGNESQPLDVGLVLGLECAVSGLHHLGFCDAVLQFADFLHYFLPPCQSRRNRRFRLFNSGNEIDHFLLNINALESRHLFLQFLLFIDGITDLLIYILDYGISLSDANFLLSLLLLLFEVLAVHQIEKRREEYGLSGAVCRLQHRFYFSDVIIDEQHHVKESTQG